MIKMFFISFVCFICFSSLSKAEKYKCGKSTLTTELAQNQSIQKGDQARCKRDSGFTEKRCPEGFVSGTYYNVPDERIESTWEGYKRFYNCLDQGSSVKHIRSEKGLRLVCRPHDPQKTYDPSDCCRPTPSDGAVNVNGSGFLKNGKIVRYTGDVTPNDCPDVFGLGSVKSGATHHCLFPFVSVACDLSIHPAGTIIEIKLLKGVPITMSENPKKTMIHPGYVVCEDTGSAIKGPGRFDFYTGPYGNHVNNIFSLKGINAELQLTMSNCNKPFRVITPDSHEDWQAAVKAIREATLSGVRRPSQSHELKDGSKKTGAR